MNHMTDDNVEQSATTSSSGTDAKSHKEDKKGDDKDNGVGIEYDYDKNAKLNEDPKKRDVEIDKFIKNLNPAGILQKMETGVNKQQVELARDKIDLALKHTGKIANEEQRRGVESLLQLQVKMLDQLMTISPLVDEFREVVKLLKV